MARSFNGTPDKIVLGTGLGLTSLSNFSVAAWAYPTAFTATNGFIFSMNNGGQWLELSIKSNQKIDFDARIVGGGASHDNPGATSLTANVWAHAMATWDSVAGSVVYFNGVSDGTSAAPVGNIGGATINSNIGVRGDSGAGTFISARLAHVAIWNVTLTSAEAAALAKGASPSLIRPSALLGYWPIDGLASPEPDLSGKAHNGTVTGTALAPGPPVAPFTPRGQPILLPVEGISGGRGFGATVGAGATDTISTTLTTDPTQRSWWGWYFARVAAPSVAGRGFDQAAGAAVTGPIFFQNTTQEWRFNASWTVTNGVWSPTVNPTVGVWHSIGISYDHSSTANSAIMYVDGVKLTVGSGLTAINSPAGTYNSGAGNSHFVGNRLGNDRVWDGYIGEQAVWDNVLLTDAEFSGLARGIRPYNIRPNLLAGYWPINGLTSPEPDLSGKVRNGTVTGTRPAFGPPISPFSPRWPQNTEIPAAPSFNPAWRVPFNQVVSGGVAT